MRDIKKPYCIGQCDFISYYKNQAGSGFNNVTLYRGAPFQRGYGLGATISKYGIPILRFIGKHVYNIGKDIISDIQRTQTDPKEIIKTRLKSGGKSFIKDALTADSIDQVGSGRKRKRHSKGKRGKKTKNKRKRKDIFDIK